ncbi:hypothetical protein [Mycobacterium sp. E796]|uniref:hypothetical protein n=1 Tax=Mycobacterium sp. E796 TaxID=1834151 RepID=UPI000A583A1E|nr:hypothetical protein [Mycobacterium sp. E796]
MTAEVAARIPVIVGAAQVVQRPGTWSDPADAPSALDLMTDALHDAARDAGSPSLLSRLDWAAVVGGFWRYRNPAQVLATRLGATPRGLALTAISGSAPQDAVGLAAARIAEGQLNVAAVVGGEAAWTARRLRKLGIRGPEAGDDDGSAPEMLGRFPAEVIDEGRSFGPAAAAYALFDDARRFDRGESLTEHRRRLAQLWWEFNQVAADNDYAWDRRRRTVEEIGLPTPDNRLIAYPYTLDMVANNTVDMASAVLMTDLATARGLGISEDRLVFPWVSAHGHETWQIADRPRLHQTSVLRAMGVAASAYTGVAPGEAAHIDLYACFPSVVQMSTEALGIDTQRVLTLTGGLSFAGAPVANSSGQGLAVLVDRVRHGGHGFVHANGGYATKHAIGLYSNSPPAQPFRRLELGDEAASTPRSDDRPGLVEAATVVFDREGAEHVLAAVTDHGGRRRFAKTARREVIDEVLSTGLAGRQWEWDE